MKWKPILDYYRDFTIRVIDSIIFLARQLVSRVIVVDDGSPDRISDVAPVPVQMCLSVPMLKKIHQTLPERCWIYRIRRRIRMGTEKRGRGLWGFVRQKTS